MLAPQDYTALAQQINWAEQPDFFQQGHQFYLNYNQLYEANQANATGKVLDLHSRLVVHKAAPKAAKREEIVGEKDYAELLASATKKIKFLQRNLAEMTENEQESAKKKIKFLQRLVSQPNN